ncbi:hypothetical protein GCK32_013116 [Trichostrongylus colubriformis]|uniref:Uncharacterized protein n=1 Tax=Trichostrongylus colubriformis TaxID=6319 RepID=A0AAN8G1M1_TRICO
MLSNDTGQTGPVDASRFRDSQGLVPLSMLRLMRCLFVVSFVVLILAADIQARTVYEECIRQCANPCGENCDNVQVYHKCLKRICGKLKFLI